MTAAFECAGCDRLFCWGCYRELAGRDHEIKTIGSRYCNGCGDAEAAAHGLTVETVRAARAGRTLAACEHRDLEPLGTLVKIAGPTIAVNPPEATRRVAPGDLLAVSHMRTAAAGLRLRAGRLVVAAVDHELGVIVCDHPVHDAIPAALDADVDQYRDTLYLVESRPAAAAPQRNWTLKVRSNPGAPIRGDYECPTCGCFEASPRRDEAGDPPATERCPSCGAVSVWRPSAALGRVKLGEVMQGKVMDYPPGAVCMDTRPLADGMPVHEWRAKQEAITRDINLKRHRDARR
jgi:hypothetical protein